MTNKEIDLAAQRLSKQWGIEKKTEDAPVVRTEAPISAPAPHKQPDTRVVLVALTGQRVQVPISGRASGNKCRS
jgi:hypothetical protein